MIVHGLDGTIAAIGRRSRKIPAALRRAVRERDGYRCTFPGCHTRRTEVHHIIYWTNGGKTEFWNLILLCARHHHLVHARGYLIARTGAGWTFTSPSTGRTLTPATPLPASTTPASSLHDQDITPDTIQQATGERLDLHYAIWAALHNGRLAQERYARAA
jgi:HNH endonuclease